jgi:hypothetical protein
MEAFWTVQLGLPADEFWRCTPRRFDAYAKAHARQEERLDYRAGLAASILVNSNKRTGAPVQPLDFFGGRKALDPEALAQKAKYVFAAAAPAKK